MKALVVFITLFVFTCGSALAHSDIQTSSDAAVEALGLKIVSPKGAISPLTDNELTLTLTTNLTVRSMTYTTWKFSGCNGAPTSPANYTFTTSGLDVTLLAGTTYSTSMAGNWQLVSNSTPAGADYWHYTGGSSMGAVKITFYDSLGTVLASKCTGTYFSASSASNVACSSGTACQFYAAVGNWQVN